MTFTLNVGICGPICHKIESPSLNATVSHHISRKAGTTLLHSPRTAAATGRPFNVTVCISTWALGITAKDASCAFRHMRRQKFGRWASYTPRGAVRTKNGTPADTWEFEAPGGRHHVHWMLHVRPNNLVEFTQKLERWVKAMAGLRLDGQLPEGALYIGDVTNAEGKKLYMAKGLDPIYAKLWGIRPVDCGKVYGRRAGTAPSLGPAVWKRLKKAHQARLRNRG